MRLLLNLLALGVFLPLITPPPANASTVRDARRHIATLRYDLAEPQLVDLARTASGEEKQEALYLLAGLKNSVSEAQIIYQEVIRLDPSSQWSERSHVELAKIQYALGNYDEALRVLEGSSACRSMEEACYFQGLAAVMLERFEEARVPLSNVRRGRYRPWAYLALAEIEMNLDNLDEACQKYRSMAKSSINPTAMYRYAECLEKSGDTGEARNAFADIVRSYKNTPEGVLARQKLKGLARTPAHPSPEPEKGTEVKTLTAGFTLQFGAFHDRMNAIKLAADLKPQLPGIRIDSDLVRFKEVHRVRLGYYATREEAQKKAQEIRDRVDEPVSIMPLP